MSAGIDYSDRIVNLNWLPSQYFDAHRNRHLRPEQRLWFACLDDAIKSYNRSRAMLPVWHYQGAGSRAQRYQELRDWFLSEQIYPGSFRFCADALSIDGGAILKRLGIVRMNGN